MTGSEVEPIETDDDRPGLLVVAAAYAALILTAIVLVTHIAVALLRT